MKLYVVRHAQTESNEKRLINSVHDEPISDEGFAQLREFVKQMRQYELDAVFSSPLKRAIQTAKPIAEDQGIKITVEPLIAETGARGWIMKPIEEFEKMIGVELFEALHEFEHDSPENGVNSAQDVGSRVKIFIDYLRGLNYESVFAVTHGDVIPWFYELLSEEKASKLHNLSLHKFTL